MIAQVDVLLLASSSEPGQACTVMDATRNRQATPGWESLDDAVNGDLEAYRLDPATTSVDSGYLRLPSGKAAFTGHEEGDGSYARTYYFVDDDSWFVLGCASRKRLDDDWLSLADTFEFLPAGQPG